ncbi:hypothetical protein Daus18300_009161 [Diaporthe australafricana]|uniref:Extracellular membrane protein CFEM domain-containing protein n=1 Tax=Diaporthe australafricana TaxID=127596 RepID=A0ABR3WFA8_9PEZI
MKLANIQHSALAVFLAIPMASSISFGAKPLEGCSLVYRHNIAAAVSCGNRNAVENCLMGLAEDQDLLQDCLVSAGCTLQDAEREATWAAESCKTNPNIEENNVELRQQQHGRPGSLRAIREVVEVRAAAAAAADEEKTTLATSATPDVTAAAGTSTNTWIMINHVTGTSYTTTTCMTATTVQTSECSFINAAEDTACVATTAVVPTCVPGMYCSFSQTSGSVKCVVKGGMETSGIVVAGVLGVAAFIAISTLCFMGCRERRAHKRDRRAAEAQAALAATAAAKRPSRAGTGVGGGDYAPLMGAGVGAQGPPERPGRANPFSGGHQYYDSR